MTNCPPHLTRQIIEHGTDSVVCTDAEGKVIWVNPQFTRLTGYSLNEVQGRKPGSFLQGERTCPDTVDRLREALGEGRQITEQILNYNKSGAPYWIELTITAMRDQKGKITHFISIERDITEYKEANERLVGFAEREKKKYNELNLIGQMSSWLFATQSMDELVVVIEQSMCHIFPHAYGQIYIYSNSRDCLDYKGGWGEKIDSCAQLKPDECWGLRMGKSYTYGGQEISLPCSHSSGVESAYACLPIIAHGETIGLLHLQFPRIPANESREAEEGERLLRKMELAQICVEQISLAAAIVRLQTELLDKSVKDALTGLWNRRWLLDMAARELRRANSTKKPLSLVMLDVDHFKRFNDEHGHDAGDTVLKVLSAHLAEIDKEGIFPARFGGEEFAILCTNTDSSSAEALVAELRAELTDGQIIHAGHKLPAVTFSVGIAQASTITDLRTLINCADKALYAAKAAGRNQTIIYSLDLPTARKPLAVVEA